MDIYKFAGAPGLHPSKKKTLAGGHGYWGTRQNIGRLIRNFS